MTRKLFGATSLVILVILAGSASPLCALEVPLNTVQFPEKRTVDVPFAATPRAPAGATLEGEVESRGVEARIELSFHNLAPAVLFGGQINSYVLWAITRDGVAQNLGELWGREESGKARFQTGLKEFAMLVTAEPIPGMARPSDLVVFISQPVRSKYAKNSSFSFSGFRPAVRRDQESIGSLRYQGREPLELYQARRIYETAQLAGIADYDARSMAEAKTTLAQATNSASSGGSSRVVADYSRRTVSLVSTAARAMSKAVAEREEAELAERRRAAMSALGQKAVEAEQNAAAADAARKRAEIDRESATRAQAEAAAAGGADGCRQTDGGAKRRGLGCGPPSGGRGANPGGRAPAPGGGAKAAADRAKDEAAQQTAMLQEQKAAADRAKNPSARRRSWKRRGISCPPRRTPSPADRDRVQKDRDALEQRLSGALCGSRDDPDDGPRNRREPARDPVRHREVDPEALGAGRTGEDGGRSLRFSRHEPASGGIHGLDRHRRGQRPAFEEPRRLGFVFPPGAGNRVIADRDRRLRLAAGRRTQYDDGRPREKPPGRGHPRGRSGRRARALGVAARDAFHNNPPHPRLRRRRGLL